MTPPDSPTLDITPPPSPEIPDELWGEGCVNWGRGISGGLGRIPFLQQGLGAWGRSGSMAFP